MLTHEGDAQIFLVNPYIAVGPDRKFENLSAAVINFAVEHADKVGVHTPYPRQLKLAVEESDHYIGGHGQHDLIREKGLSQAAMIVGILADSVVGNQWDEYYLDIDPFMVETREAGGRIVHLLSDVGCRRKVLDKLGPGRFGVRNQRRVLNFYFEDGLVKDRRTTPNLLIDELLAYYETEFGEDSHLPSVRISDGSLGLVTTLFPLRTSAHRKSGVYSEPSVEVTTGCETVGVFFERDPLADRDTSRKFLEYLIDKNSTEHGLSPRDTLLGLNGRAGACMLEVLLEFSRVNGIYCEQLAPGDGEIAKQARFKAVLEGGSEELLTRMLLSVNRPDWSPKRNDFSIKILPSGEGMRGLLM